MKKQLIIFTIALFCVSVLVFFISSCNKEDVATNKGAAPVKPSSRDIDGHELRMGLIALSPSEQRLAFEEFSSEEKVAVWLDKLDGVLALSGWTSAQIDLIEDLRDQVNEELWSDNSTVHQNFVNNFHDDWKNDALHEFTFDELGWIVATLDDYASGPYTPPSSEECDCSVKSDWCPVWSECFLTSCITTAHGCGTIWVYKCTGECDY